MIATTTRAVPTMNPAYGQGPQQQPTGNLSFFVSNLCSWQVDALHKLATFELLPPNWDSYGSPRPSDNVLDFTRSLIAGITVTSVPAPRIIPISGGGIQLYWEKGTHEIDLKVHSDLTSSALVVENGEILAETPIQSLSASMINALLSWLDRH